MQQGPIEIEDKELKNRVRAFTGAFIAMISPVLLAIVLMKVNLTGAGKYEGRIRVLEASVDLVQRRFAHLAAFTLQTGVLPFLCVMISEACARSPPSSYIVPRLKALTNVLVFHSSFWLMVLGCGILLLFHTEALLLVSFCSIMAIIVTAMHVAWFWRFGVIGVENVRGTAEEAAEYHGKLEQALEFSAGVTVMMFLVLESVALEGLLRNSQGCLLPQPAAPAPSSEGPDAIGQAILFISFFTGALGVSLMNVWTTPLVVNNSEVLTTAFMMGLNFLLHAVPSTAVVVLITLQALPRAWRLAVWLPLLPPIIVLLVLLARSTCGDGDAIGILPMGPEDQKPAPLELTKVAFTGFLAVAVLMKVTNASPSIASNLFLFFTAATVVLGLLWRLLTLEAKPSAAVLKAANHASFFAHLFFFCAGVAFWVMAVSATK